METLRNTLTAIPALLPVNDSFVPVSSIAKLTVETDTLAVKLSSGDNVSLSGEELKTFLHGFKMAQERQVNGQQKLLTYEQIAYRYQVEVRTVKSWVKSKKLKAVKITKRCVRFDTASCDARLLD